VENKHGEFGFEIIFDCALLLNLETPDCRAMASKKILNDVPHQLKSAVMEQNRQCHPCRGYPQTPQYNKKSNSVRTWKITWGKSIYAEGLMGNGGRKLGWCTGCTTVGGMRRLRRSFSLDSFLTRI
jgi:hypothetical protein